MTALTVALLVLFIGLGRWQWGRAEAKVELQRQFDAAAGTVVDLGARATGSLPRYAAVVVRGEWDAERQFLLENRTRAGRAGYEVLTPLRLRDGRWLLVNRGWLPFEGYRDRLPDVAAALREGAGAPGAAADRLLRGRLDELPAAGLASGRAAPATKGNWPRVASFPAMEELARALATPQDPQPRVEPRVLLLDSTEPQGYARDWKPLARGPEQNWSYAIQWWSFSVVLLILYVALNLERPKGDEARTQ
jgi:surfeit locus 1 family protein